MKTWRLLLASLIATVTVTALARSAAAQCTHKPIVSITTVDTNVDHPFQAGSRWVFDVHKANCEGLIINNARYTADGGVQRKVLGSARISQIHVPYATGTPRYLDVTTDSTGLGDKASTLGTWPVSECEGGTKYDSNKICKQYEHHGVRWRYGAESRPKEMVVVFMSSQVGDYNYVNRWEFHDDGTIEAKLGLTGALQQNAGVKDGTGYVPYGGRLNPESETIPRIGIAHWHNVYYRLDFDIDGASNDRVDRVTWVPSTAASPDGTCTNTGKCGKISFTPITTEAAQTWSPTTATTWHIYDKSSLNEDGRRRGYSLVPHVAGLHRGMTTTSEPWAGSELWVSNFASCEIFAVANEPPALSTSCSPTTPKDITAMTTGSSSVDGADVVVWYRNSHLHVPRDEDQDFMPVEWMSLEMKPRSFHPINPAP